MMLAQPIVDSLIRETGGIPHAGVRVSIAVVITFLLAITALLLFLKAKEADQSASQADQSERKPIEHKDKIK